MALHVALTHRTQYTYDRLTGLSPQMVRLRPAPHSRTPILSYSLKRRARRRISSTGSKTRSATIWRGWSFPEKTREFAVTVDLVADMAVINPFDFFVDE